MNKLTNWSGNGSWVEENFPSQGPGCKKKHSNLPKTKAIQNLKHQMAGLRASASTII